MGGMPGCISPDGGIPGYCIGIAIDCIGIGAPGYIIGIGAP
jgi:hypothetical protein